MRGGSRGGAFVVVGAFVLVAFAVFPVAASARSVYVSSLGPDTVSAFTIGANGTLTALGPPVASGANPVGVAVSPDGRDLYVANRSGSVSAFTIGANGTLTAVGSFAAGTDPRGVAVTPDGRRLYVTNFGSNNVTAFTINGDGTLTATGPPVAVGGPPVGVAVSPGGRHLYVTTPASDHVSAFTINGDGTLTAVGPPVTAGDGPTGVAVSPGGRHLYVTSQSSSDVSAFTINADGTLTTLGPPVATGTNPPGVAISPDGRHLYVPNLSSDNVSAFTVNADGTLTAVGSFAAGDFTVAVAVTPDGRHLYATNSISSDVSAFTINADGTLTAVGPPVDVGDSSGFQSVAIQPNQGPTAAFSTAPAASASPRRNVSAAAAVAPGEPIRFNAAGSSDPDGQVARYAWDFGDGTTLPNGGPTPSHRYSSAGSYQVTLTVTDNEGCAATFVYTGQTAHCNATAAAVARRTISITATHAPEPPAEGDPEADQQDEATDEEDADQSAIAGADASGGDQLPFTGLEIALLIYIGGLLLTAGAALRSATRTQRR